MREENAENNANSKNASNASLQPIIKKPSDRQELTAHTFTKPRLKIMSPTLENNFVPQR